MDTPAAGRTMSRIRLTALSPAGRGAAAYEYVLSRISATGVPFSYATRFA